MRVFKTKAFARFSNQEGITDEALCDAIRQAEKALIDADLGGGVIKQRLARKGQGKSGGYRSIVLFRRGERAFFAYGFAKKDQANIRPDELKAFRKLADVMLGLDDESLAAALKNGTIVEIRCHG
jgi:hypothetical protein